MPKSFSDFLVMMDERLWFRMIVCMLPGLVAAKLFGLSSDNSLLNNIGTGVLVIGVALYAFWGRMRSAPTVDEAELDETPREEGERLADYAGTGISGKDQLGILAELRALCQEADRESDRLISVEIAVNPSLSFADATKSALARKRMGQE